MSSGRRAILHGILGAWLGITLCTIAGAVMSFRAAGATRTEAASSLEPAARSQAARFNVRMFLASGRAQILLAGLAVALAAWPPRASTGAVISLVIAAGIVLFLAAIVVPRTAELGREMIAGALGESDGRARMQRLHRVYAMLDLAKSLLIVTAFTLSARGPRPRAETGAP